MFPCLSATKRTRSSHLLCSPRGEQDLSCNHPDRSQSKKVGRIVVLRGHCCAAESSKRGVSPASVPLLLKDSTFPWCSHGSQVPSPCSYPAWAGGSDVGFTSTELPATPEISGTCAIQLPRVLELWNSTGKAHQRLAGEKHAIVGLSVLLHLTARSPARNDSSSVGPDILLYDGIESDISEQDNTMYAFPGNKVSHAPLASPSNSRSCFLPRSI